MRDLTQAQRIVIKLGSTLIVDADSGELRRDWLASLIADVAACHQRGQEIIIVSSGAIALGRSLIQAQYKALRVQQAQAAGAVGQVRLIHAYQELLAAQQISMAQILLTLSDSEDRKRYLNASNTFKILLQQRVIPVVNENDTVATSEIRYGDNDRLAARVAQMVQADCLILLSDIDGLYTADPHYDPQAQWIPLVEDLDSAIRNMAGESHSRLGSGGMRTKLAAADICMHSGCDMLIAPGKVLHPLRTIEQGGRATRFKAKLNPQRAHKQWLGQHLQIKGQLLIDDGAAQALRQGKSLLAAGVTAVEGRFDKGDAVSILARDRTEIARGLCQYPSTDALKLIGCRCDAIIERLGYHDGDALVHRNHLVLHKS